jgi:hypothetical protein
MGGSKRKSLRFLFLIVLSSLVLTDSAFAGTFGPFPGLGELIQRSDAIVVVDILEQKNPFRQPRFGGRQDYEASVLKVIKGEIPEGTTTLSLRFLPVGFARGTASRAEFYFGQRQIVFLRKVQQEGKVSYAMLDYEGGHMQVSPHTDLSKLKGKEPKQIVSELLESFLEFKREELDNLERQIDTILKKD